MSTEAPYETPAVCPKHPGTAAPYVCQRCQTAVCHDCCYSMADGSICCKSCFEALASPPPTGEPADAKPRLNIRQSSSSPAPIRPAATASGLGPCLQHAEVAAMARCRECGAASCATCNFTLPGNLHYCPVCAASLGRKLSPRRKTYLTAAYWLAAVSTLSFLLWMVWAGEPAVEDEASQLLLGSLFILLTGLPATVGTGMAMSALRTVNPPSVWVALVWNGLVQGLIFALVIIGNFME